jgi:S-adenosylmethionine synthetase
MAAEAEAPPLPPPLPAGNFLFTSEAVTDGQPDKLCDRVADAVLDACLAQDPDARVACEACTKAGMVMILGEIVTKATVNYEQVIREAVKAVGYDSDEKGLDWRTMNVIMAVDEHGPELAQAITTTGPEEATGPVDDQGVAFGYATDECVDLMPLSHVLATKLCTQLDKVRKDGTIAWLRPSGGAQVVVQYREEADGAVVPVRVHSVSLSVQHAADTTPDQVEKDLMAQVVQPAMPKDLCDATTQYLFRPSKPLASGSSAHAGLSGRKACADMYGGWGSHSDGALAGHDASKFSRCAAYGARWAARSLVAARLCRRCIVQLSYNPSAAQHVCINVHTYGSGKASGRTDVELATLLAQNFDFRPACLQRDLGLKGFQFQKLSAYGHLGRSELEVPWEKPKELK